MGWGLVPGAICGRVIELRSGATVLGIDSESGAVVRLADDAHSSIECVVAGAPVDLLRIAICAPGDDPLKPRELSSGQAARVAVEPGAAVRVRFDRLAGEQLGALCTIEPVGDGRFRFRARVEGGPGTILERLDFPAINLRAPLEGDGAGDALALGTTKGGVHERPHGWSAGRIVSARQPGTLAAQFGCYHGSSGGVVTFTEDNVGWPKALAFARGRDGIAVGWRHYARHDLGRAFELSYPVVAGTFGARGCGASGLAGRRGGVQGVGAGAAVVRAAVGSARRSAPLAA